MPHKFSITRDAHGIPHVRAADRLAAFAGQAFAMCEDRFWQMEVDRRYSSGTLSSLLATDGAKASDAFIRRSRVVESYKDDIAALNASTREMLHAFAVGVNAYLAECRAGKREWPVEWRELNLPAPEDWMVVDSLAVFKGRHLTMGNLGNKMARWKMVNALGPELAAKILAAAKPPLDESHVILKDGLIGESEKVFAEDGVPELKDSVPSSTWSPGFSADALIAEFETLRSTISNDAWGSKWADGIEQGSNCWVVDGRWTASGAPLGGGDPHRQADFPNVYYQNHVTCPEFDVIGMSFPGVPGFAHFGHNQDVAWYITHAMYSNVSLFLEKFPSPTTYLFRGQELPILSSPSTVDPSMMTHVTHHGPVILGSPDQGWGVSMRWLGAMLDSEAVKEGQVKWVPNRFMDCLEPMMRAGTVDELDEACRHWSEPQNNLLIFSAPTSQNPKGEIRYLNRGLQIVRSSSLDLWTPVPGWTGEHEWKGLVPFEELPRGVGGSTGKIVTANNPIVGSGWKYGPLSIDYAPEGRFVRIHEMLGGKKEGSIVPADYAEIHKDRITSTAESFLSLILDEQFTVEGVEKEALALLNEWRKQPVMDRDTAAPLLYVLLRTQILALLESLPGAPLTKLAKTVDPHLGGEDGMVKLLTVIGGKQWSALSNWAKSRTPEVLPPGYTWERLAKEAFKSAVKMAVDRFGSDVGKWRYGSVHKSAPKHAANAVLSEEQKQRFNAVPLEMGGDADTVQAAGGWEEVVLQSVARYVFDPSENWARSSWIVPLGVSGDPLSKNSKDQTGKYANWEMIPMLYDWTEISRVGTATEVVVG